MNKFSEKYTANYMKQCTYGKAIKSILDRLIETEAQLDLSFFEWSNDQIRDFLISFHSISPSVLNKVLNTMRDFSDYICEKEGTPKREFSLGFDMLHELVDYEKLMETVINYHEYQHIKSQLRVVSENIRDVVIFELAWIGLKNEEIKMLKESDVTFEFSEIWDADIAFVRVNDKKKFRVEDPDVAEDLKKCIDARYYYINDKNGVSKRMNYKESEYLIKPVQVGRSKKEDWISNPSWVLQTEFIKNDIKCEGISMPELSVEDIRRSKIVYLLSPDNEPFFDFTFINVYFDFGSSDSTLFWLKKVSKLKYE